MSNPYNVYAYPYPVFQPSMRIITAITQSNPAIVTTSFAHQYKTGTIVRLDVPEADGMPQINQQTGTITILSPTTFSITIDSTNYQAFAIPMTSNPHINTAAQVVPIGENSTILTASVQNVLPYGAN